jgi:ethanolamine kinase
MSSSPPSDFTDDVASPTTEERRRILYRSIAAMTPQQRQQCLIPHPILNGSQRGWDNEDAFCRDIRLETLTGGNSNAAYVVTFGSGGLTPCDEKHIPRPLLLKVYGTAMGKIVDRSADVGGSIAASSVSLGPGVVALFDWGRLEVFLPGYNNHTTTLWMNREEPWYLRSVATALRTLHERCSSSASSAVPAPSPSQPASLELHLSRFLSCFADASVAAKEEDRIVKDFFAACEAEKDWLLDRCLAIGDPLVFSHSDSNPSNLMWKKVTSPTTPPTSSRSFSTMRVPIQPQQADHQADGSQSSDMGACYNRSGEMMELFLIDYEYCGWNFPFFDLGNVICEMDYDYEASHGTPTTEPVSCTVMADGENWNSTERYYGFVKPIAEQHKHDDYHFPRLAKNILSRVRAIESASPAEQNDLASHIVENFVAPFFDVPVADLTVDNHFRRLALGMLSSSLKWGVWGCAVCSHEAKHNPNTATVTLPRGSSGLDYAAYSECRLKDYEALKKFLLQEKLL